jgi:hypothetical protein
LILTKASSIQIRSSEGSYRRGYYQGYGFAIEDFLYLLKKSRSKLEAHYLVNEFLESEVYVWRSKKNEVRSNPCFRSWLLEREKQKHIANAYSAKRRAALKRAIPSWVDSNHFEQIKTFYEEAKKRSQRTGERWNVDHIIPLCGKTVCGLHLPWNLQLLTEKENMQKSNKSWPDCWENS